MHPLIPGKKLILASNSPRRKEILERSGFVFEVLANHVDESYPSDLEYEHVAEYIAQKKATSAMANLKNKNEILLTADSIVIHENTIFEKPENADDAHRMIRKLSNQWHEVITGVCLSSLSKQVAFSSLSRVLFGSLSKEEIEYYIHLYKPFDKAGAYGIQDWIGFCKVQKIEGLYSNIMGLPMERVYEALKSF